MHALDILGDPVRRRILEMLSSGELSAGEVGITTGRVYSSRYGR